MTDSSPHPRVDWAQLMACGEARRIHAAGLPKTWDWGGIRWEVRPDGLHFQIDLVAEQRSIERAYMLRWEEERRLEREAMERAWAAAKQLREKQQAAFLASDRTATLRRWLADMGNTIPEPGIDDYLTAMDWHTLDKWPVLRTRPLSKREHAALAQADADIILRELGYLLGVSVERARQIKAKAQRRLDVRMATWVWHPLSLPARPATHPDFAEQVWTPVDQYREIAGLDAPPP